MSWREFIASLVESLAWPSAGVTIAWLLRGHLSRLVDSAQGRIKGFGFEAEWDRQVGEVSPAIIEAGEATPELEAGAPVEALPAGHSKSLRVEMAAARIKHALCDRLGVKDEESKLAPIIVLSQRALDAGVIKPSLHRSVAGIAALYDLSRLAGHDITEDKIQEFEVLSGAVRTLVETADMDKD